MTISTSNKYLLRPMLIFGCLLAIFMILTPALAVETPAVDAEIERQANEAQRTTKLDNPLGTNSIPELIGRFITILTGVSGTVALLMFVYGGFLWLTSAGNEEQVSKGKKIFTWATIGLVIIFMAYAIVNQIFKTVGAV